MKVAPIIAIALLIIVPMSVILISYSNNQLKTLQYQVSYDTKLRNSTYDAVKAFQLNMSNSMTSDLANSKMRDIEASINVFYTSLTSNFSTSGYSKETLRNYVPAIVYTLYDGYYIYSAYDNTLTNVDIVPGTQYSAGETYEDGERIYGLKPYIYYSCRYKPNDNNSDFVITYSLDSYITIQGTIDGMAIDKSGYLLTGVDKSGDKYTYRGITIEPEDGNNLRENIYVEDYNDDTTTNAHETGSTIVHKEGSLINALHIKFNGVKYYINKNKTTKYPYDIFSMLNDDRNDTPSTPVTVDDINNNKQGIKYYEEAYKFKQFILGNQTLKNLKSSDAVDIKGNKYEDNGPYTKDVEIFKELDNINSSTKRYIEDQDSDFYLHRTEVIKNAIESNLMVAIDNFNKVSSSSTQFAMPKLSDKDWENLTNGISMITFLQGLSIGGRVYNGYSIVSNDINDDFVGDNSVYIVAGEKYYLPTDTTLLEVDLDNAVGVLNSNFELKTVKDTITTSDGSNNQYDRSYYPRAELAAYTSIVNPGSSANSKKKVYDLMKEYAKSTTDSKKKILARIYYTALGRERYSMYKVNR